MPRTLSVRVGYLPSFPPATIRTYTAPAGSPVSSRFSVAVNGSTTCTYQIPLDAWGERDHYANFETDAATAVTVTVTVTGAVINSAIVRPDSRNVTPQFTPGGNTLEFQMTDPDTFCVVINNDWDNPLFVHANPYEANPPGPGDVTYYYGPGLYNNVKPNGTPLNAFWGELRLTAGQTVYVHGSAYVYGKIWPGPGLSNVGPNTNNINVSGYGVVDSTNSTATMGTGRACYLGNVNGGSVKGITIINNTHFGLIMSECNNILLQHAKIYSIEYNQTDTPDGMDIIGSSNITYDHCFIRSSDDCIAIKTWKSGFGTAPFWRGNVENVDILDCVFHCNMGGNGIDIGYENFNNTTDGTTPIIDPTTGLQIAFVRNINVQRLDIVRMTFAVDIIGDYRCTPLSIHATDNTPVSNVLFEDVNVDEIIDMNGWIFVGSGAWDTYTYGQRGPITGVTFRRVNMPVGSFSGASQDWIRLIGGSPTQRISGVTFEDVYIEGTKVTSAASVAGKWTWSSVNTDTPTFI